MIKKNEFLSFLLVSLILIFTLSIRKPLASISYISLSIILVLLINIFAKKITGFYLGTKVKIKIWEIKKVFYNKQKKGPGFQAGIFFPLIFNLLSGGYFTWFGNFVFDIESKAYRVSKKYGVHAFSEMTEYHLALIAGIGILSNLSFGVLGYLINLPKQMNFINLNILFAFFNLLPISDLDGNKIFFGSKTLWVFLFLLTLIGLSYILI